MRSLLAIRIYYEREKKRQYWTAYMENYPPIMKAPIAKIWHVLKAKAIAALEKYVSVSTFAH